LVNWQNSKTALNHEERLNIVAAIKHLLETIGYPGIFLAMAIEGSGIPLPSEITMPFAGFLTVGSKHQAATFQIQWVIVVGAIAEVTGALVGYGVGLVGGRPLLERYGRLVMIHPQDIDRVEGWFDRFGAVVVFVARLLPAVRSYVSIAAGIGRMDIRSFVFWSILGSLAWCTFLALLGRQLGKNWQSISTAVRPFEIPLFAVVILAVAAYVLWRHVLRAPRPRGEIES
jgi:membrane protein DedA with SNARE-associated domain